ncbi:Dyp-type peroxidase [Rhizobium leguminosarum]|uniref:Dyp-type peroxidase n=1 Tax=Rhizobium leguminosarum TaxID=384 RepID=UPI003F986A1A
MSGFLLEPVLDIDEIQGNILAGFNKDFQAFLFLAIPQQADFALVRAWIAKSVERLAFLDEVAAFKRQFRAVAGGIPGADPPFGATWMNIAFSYGALLRLTDDAGQFDPVFRDGIAAAVGRLGDPMDPSIRGHISQWKVGAPGKLPDILVIIAADREQDLQTRLQREQALAADAGLVEIHIDFGRDLSHSSASGAFPSGREHFGFKDGVSQPAVRGRMSSADNDFLVPRDTINEPGTSIEYASPGRPLICPGEFVLGYPRQSDALGTIAAAPWPLGDQAPVGNITAPPIGPLWAKNGSFLVYRRLNQDVPAFNRFLRDMATKLAADCPEFAALNAEQLGALLVGRWQSGAPVLRSPNGDNPDLAATIGANNAFDFSSQGAGSDGFPPAVSDPEGEICPAASHIRKVNPRALPTDQGGEVTTLVRRILRRGIPFGASLPFGADDPSLDADRGLLFVSYQSSIQHQFEFLQMIWANSESKPTPQLTGSAGHDLVIGQGAGSARKRFILLGPKQRRVEAPSHVEWVYPTGGGYFFTPSRSALKNVLGVAVSDNELLVAAT